MTFFAIPPQICPPLDSDFRPAAIANRAFRQAVEEAGGGEPLVLALERPGGSISRLETRLLPVAHPKASANFWYAERLFKFFLWQRGGFRAWVGGPEPVGRYLQSHYSPTGTRLFDHHFMGETVYGHSFIWTLCSPEEVPPAQERYQALGGHLDGCRIGFDLGASDRKVAAVVDGQVVFSEEVIWEPTTQTDPRYHYDEIRQGLQRAAEHLPRVDAIGGSAAGVYVENQVRVASLFRGIPPERFDQVRTLFLRLGQELGVPLVVLNDGEVAALAGAMSLETTALLGLALGSSEAAGFVTPEGLLTDWLDELAFAPIDYNPQAPADDWSGDRGVGAQYLSQQAVFRLAPKVGIHIPEHLSKAEKLAYVQEYLERGHEGARLIWETIGVYLGYAIAHYADFYPLQHVLILGRCTSGSGGRILLEAAQRVLRVEFPDLADSVEVHLPDERSRRVGQAVAAASLPVIPKP
ncbi:MAG: ROK family protein [Anaerolineae bacterium]|nr:ROK family protein [Anaerolineae bacterium]MCX8068620.1 ROK family protein [Anaerolineae bacterium]MDW7992443.1 ROK family protein [Anaerolineae bacterium]